MVWGSLQQQRRAYGDEYCRLMLHFAWNGEWIDYHEVKQLRRVCGAA